MSDPVLAATYLDLLKKTLNASLFEQSRWHPAEAGQLRGYLRRSALKILTDKGFVVMNPRRYSLEDVEEGKTWTNLGFTMVSLKRLDNVQACVEDVLAKGVPGDLVETGIWKGGVTILMRAILKAHGDADRLVWAADSFEGLPVPKDDQDGADLSKVDALKISLERVQDHFRRFNMLDDRVRFLKGWFADTLPTAPIEKIAVLRLDGDLYSSTMDALQNLYHKVSPGGYVIVDDYYSWPGCQRAVQEYLAAHGHTPDIKPVDWTCCYWQVPAA
jgi:O-methyltransferase